MLIRGQSFHHDKKKLSTNVWMGKPLHFPTQPDRGSLYTRVKNMYIVHDGGVAPHYSQNIPKKWQLSRTGG